MKKYPYVWCMDPEKGEYVYVYYKNPNIFGKKIRELREAKGLTIAQLSDEIRWAEDCVRRWEKGDMVEIVTLRKLANYFKVTTEYLLSPIDEKNEQLSLF